MCSKRRLITTLTVFDAHMHIIDPHFPLIENNGFLPDPFDCQDYLGKMSDVNLIGGVVVSGSFQGFDQSYLIHALQGLGKGFVGVTQLPATVSDDELFRLNDAGVRAVRFNLKRGGSEGVAQLEYLACRVFDLVGWHTELYVDSQELDALRAVLCRLPAVSIDHLGLSKAGLPNLLKLVEYGVKVKATGFSRVDFDVVAALRQITSITPDALMFGTDLPSTRAPRQYTHTDLQLIIETLGEEAAKKVLYENALNFYRRVQR